MGGLPTDLAVDAHGAQGDPALDAGAEDAFYVRLQGFGQELVEALVGRSSTEHKGRKRDVIAQHTERAKNPFI